MGFKKDFKNNKADYIQLINFIIECSKRKLKIIRKLIFLKRQNK